MALNKIPVALIIFQLYLTMQKYKKNFTFTRFQ